MLRWRVERVRNVREALVYEVEGFYTVSLYGDWAGSRDYTGIREIDFPSDTKWERISERSYRAKFPRPITIIVNITEKKMSWSWR